MKYPQILAFVRVAKLGSIRAAARSMGVSQAAVTKTLRMLEEEMGVTLLSRGVRGVSLTSNGAALLPRATLIVEQMGLLPGDIRSDELARVAFAITPAASRLLLPSALPVFIARFPRAPLKIAAGHLPSVLRGLREGAIDFGICAADLENLPRNFNFEPWLRSPTVVIAYCNHPLATQACTLSDIMPYPWVQTGSRETLLGFGGEFLDKALNDPGIIESHNLIATGILLKCANALAIVPMEFGQHITANADYVMLDMIDALPESVLGLVTRADIRLSPSANVLMTLLKAAAERESRQRPSVRLDPSRHDK